MISIEYLEEERVKLWDKISSLEVEINKKTTDYESEAKQASKKASEYRNRSEEAKESVLTTLNEVSQKSEEIKSIYNSLVEINGKIIDFSTTSNNNNELTKNLFEEIQSRKVSIENKINELENVFEKHDIFIEQIKKLNVIFESSDDYSKKIEALYKSFLGRKNEIEDLYYEVFGYTDDDKETGVNTEVEGLKDKLEKSYTEISKNLTQTKDDIFKFNEETKKVYFEFKEEKEKEFKVNLDKWQNDYINIQKQINELLPEALTKGLSSAYYNKRRLEQKTSKTLRLNFNYAIAGMILISLIPFGVSTYTLIYENIKLAEVVSRLPRLVMAILPLYIPVLWLAYSANKKLNLSKRLIEEYTHKEVLSKTYEGLSKQINSIDNEDVSSELKIKLLYNVLDVSSENPGKLISDYDKSDHPLMDALDKSVKLANAVEKLSKIPGFSRIAKALEKKSKEILIDESKKAQEGLDIILNDDKNSDEKN
ncbi:MAG: hypothetical protein WC223_13880 [Bacteroidales bacterium]|jgi:uncharacterized coiled-coil DUF342 family protein